MSRNGVANLPVSGQARLILQDPLAFDQATLPNLRSSLELTAQQSANMEREKARELWESLNLTPEVAQEKQSERKRLLARSESLAVETAAAKAQALELQALLAKERDQRFHHPLVYAGVAGLLGMGALWMLERRKRLKLQHQQLSTFAEQTPSLQDDAPISRDPGHIYALEDSPDLAADYATDLTGLPIGQAAQGGNTNMALGMDSADLPADEVFAKSQVFSSSRVDGEMKSLPGRNSAEVQDQSQPLTPSWAQTPSPAESNREDFLHRSDDVFLDPRDQYQSRGFISASKSALSRIFKRKPKNDALHTSHSLRHSTQSASTSFVNSANASTHILDYAEDESTQIQFDEEAQLAFEQELMAQNIQSVSGQNYDPDQANIELLSHTRIVAHNGESVMEHLLELRTAVNGLVALGRPEGALSLLREHIEADASTCAWTYLEYMHLCEKMSLRDDFESMRKKYRLEFNRMAPYWHEPNANVLGLDGYARATHELCAAWALGPEQAQRTLSAWLVGPQIGRKIVQLTAYHDLFDLYEMLEFVEHEHQLDVMKRDHAADKSYSRVAGAQEQVPTLSAQDIVSNNELNDDESDFVPTVSLLDLDYEFSSDVTLEQRDVEQSEKAVTVVKPGSFSVDFNVAGTQMGSLGSVPAELSKK